MSLAIVVVSNVPIIVVANMTFSAWISRCHLYERSPEYLPKFLQSFASQMEIFKTSLKTFAYRSQAQWAFARI